MLTGAPLTLFLYREKSEGDLSVFLQQFLVFQIVFGFFFIFFCYINFEYIAGILRIAAHTAGNTPLHQKRISIVIDNVIFVFDFLSSSAFLILLKISREVPVYMFSLFNRIISLLCVRYGQNQQSYQVHWNHSFRYFSIFYHI